MRTTGELIEFLNGLVKETGRIVRSLRAYEQLLARPADNAYLLQQQVAAIERAAAALSARAPDVSGALQAWLTDQSAVIERAKDELRFNFGRRLKELFDKDGVMVRGQYPLLRIGMYTLKLNFEFGEATLFFGPEVEKIESKITLCPQTIHDLIQEHDRAMRTAAGDLTAAYRDLAVAYERCLKMAGKAVGEKVLISDVLKEYVFLKQSKQFNIDPRRGNFREIPRVRLSFLLYQLRNLKVPERGLCLHVATFDATTDKLRSFWVPDNEAGEGTHCAYISFEVRST